MGALEGKVAVITGASRGLGLAIARAYAREGAAVVLGARSGARISAEAAQLQAQGYRASALACDVGDLEQVQALAEYALQTYGALDIWVNNAGEPGVFGPTADIAPERFESVIRTNILGTYHGSLVAIQSWQAQGHGGKLINLLGRGDRGIAPYQSAYASSKAWVRAFTRTLAREYKDSGIGVYMLNPGLMDTDLLRKIDVVRGSEQRLGAFSAIIRLWGNPPAVPAERAVWLASAATDGKTGLERQELGARRQVGGLLREGWRLLRRRPAPDTSLTLTTEPPYRLPQPLVPERAQ